MFKNINKMSVFLNIIIFMCCFGSYPDIFTYLKFFSISEMLPSSVAIQIIQK